MSRALVNEPGGDQAEGDLPDLPQSDELNYITPAGFEKLQVRYAVLFDRKKQLKDDKENLAAKTEVKQIEKDLRFVEQRLERAVVVDPSEQVGDKIRFGARVIVIDEDDQKMEFTIAGEDETCAPTRLISWTSPLGKALLRKRKGDLVYWERPVGNVELEIESFQYGET